jgi:hypothetical protein
MVGSSLARNGRNARVGADSTTAGKPRKPLGMCIICIDFDRGRLTTKEARQALGEMVAKLDKKHAAEVEAKIEKAEAEKTQP